MTTAFFTSYARADSENGLLKKVIDDLAAGVHSLLPGVAATDVCFFDQTTIETGADWERILADGANTARVLVCLMSPTYFSRPHCAKEFDVFRRRLEAYDAVGDRRVVVPVIWRSEIEIPQTLARLQHNSDVFPKKYHEAGLRGLKRLGSQREKYLMAIDALAKIIADMARQPPLGSLAARPRFEELTNSFDHPVIGRFPLAVAVLAPLGAAGRIDPFTPTIGEQIDQATHNAGVAWREVIPGNDLAGRLAATMSSGDGAAVVVLTHETAPPWFDIARDLVLSKPWYLLVEEPMAKLVTPPSGAAGVITFQTNGPRDLKQCGITLFTDLKLRHVDRPVAMAAHDDALVSQALEQGIDTARRPEISAVSGR